MDRGQKLMRFDLGTGGLLRGEPLGGELGDGGGYLGVAGVVVVAGVEVDGFWVVVEEGG